MFYGKKGFEKLRGSFVAVIGLGGVGSFAAEVLCRAGIGRMRLVDCDVIKPSDVNRQLIALSSNVNEKKVDAAGRRLREINPDIDLDGRHIFFHHDTAEELLGGGLDFVVDAIDSMNPKAELIRICTEKGLPVISALGAAGRMDPAKVQVATLMRTEVCPLARTLRRYLRKRKVTTDIPVVYSTESPVLPNSDGPAASNETTGTYIRGRARSSLPSLPTIPALFGLIAANYVVEELLKQADISLTRDNSCVI